MFIGKGEELNVERRVKKTWRRRMAEERRKERKGKKG